jgi:hypothetical protein
VEKPAEGDVFVFGSNLMGIHGAGAAKAAKTLYGAISGIGSGIQGRSYAIPTKTSPYTNRCLDEIQISVSEFIRYAKEHPSDTFFVTRVGCGLAGYADAVMATMFIGSPYNCKFSEVWKPWLR